MAPTDFRTFWKFLQSVDAGHRFLDTQYSSNSNQFDQFKVQLNSIEFTSKLNSNQPWLMWVETENSAEKKTSRSPSEWRQSRGGEYVLLGERAEISDPFLSSFERSFQVNTKIGRLLDKNKKQKKRENLQYIFGLFCTNNCNNFVHFWHSFVLLHAPAAENCSKKKVRWQTRKWLEWKNLEPFCRILGSKTPFLAAD